MAEPITRVTLFVPGSAASAAVWSAALSGTGLSLESDLLLGTGLESKVAAEWVPNDGAFGAAFSFGTVAPDVIEALAAAPGALVLHWPVDLRQGRAEIVKTVTHLRDTGAIAVRVEESKVGWSASDWVDLYSDDDPWGWHRGVVAFLGGEEALQSCGMHAFSLPDVRVELDGDPEELHRFASVLNVYQIDEDPLLVSGQTFTPDAKTPRRVVERWPDTDYPPDHPCHNPYGVWRVAPPGVPARDLYDPTPIFVPALRVLLTALEGQEGPLTQTRVEAIRDEGVCINMAQRDAQSLERERGYADLDPELVWEQWQLVRNT